MSAYSINTKNQTINYTIKLNVRYFEESIPEYNEWLGDEIEPYKNGDAKNELAYYMYTELGGIEFIDVESNEELDHCDSEIDWDMLQEQGLKEFIEYYDSCKWMK